MLKNFSFVLTFFLFFGLSVQTQAFKAPALSGPVIDEVGLLNSESKELLTRSLVSLKQNHQIQFQVYITTSLQGEEIASAAIQIFDQWKLGDEKTDKGLLFLVAPNEKRIRIEVGQGLEGDIPDVIAKRIITDVVRPYFQSGDFNQGVVQGIVSLQQYAGAYDKNLNSQIKKNSDSKNSNSKNKLGGWAILIIVGIWLIIFFMNPSLALYILFSALSGGRGGGGGSGGGWSGGGGRSSGGGASGGW